MASRDLADLHPALRLRAGRWQAACAAAGLDVLIYCTLRPMEEQARLFRTNRRFVAIEAMAIRLRNYGLHDASRVLLDVGPQPGERGKVLTKAPPGLSFHQSHRLRGARGALAFDFCVLEGGKPLWNDRDPAVAAQYERAAELAEAEGLTWLGRSRRFKESVHVQLDDGGALDVWRLAKGAYA